VVKIIPTTNSAVNFTALASVNGRKVRAEFDTGAPLSLLSLDSAAEAGVKPDGADVTQDHYASGVALHSYVKSWIGPFDSFKLGDEEVRHTRLRFSDMKLHTEVEMLIGADFFLSHRVFVSNSQHKLYFTYNGGAVFNLDARPAASTIAASGASSRRSIPTPTLRLTPTASPGAQQPMQSAGISIPRSPT